MSFREIKQRRRIDYTPLGSIWMRYYICPTASVEQHMEDDFAPGTLMRGDSAGPNARYCIGAFVDYQANRDQSSHSLIIARFARFRRYDATAGGTDQYELSRREYRDRWGRSYGTRTFAVPAADVATHMAALPIRTLWPSSYDDWVATTSYTSGDVVLYSSTHYVCISDIAGDVGNDNPSVDTDHWRATVRLLEKRIEDRIVDTVFPGYPGWARIIAHYRSPTLTQVSEEAENRGVLFVDISSQGERAIKDLDGNLIEGEVTETIDGKEITRYWKVVSGSNFMLKPKCTIRCRVALNQPNVATYMGMVGDVNDDALPNFGSAAAGTMLFTGARMSFDLTDLGFTIADLYFMYEPDGWNSVLQSQKFEYRTEKVRDHDDDDKTFAIRLALVRVSGTTQTMRMFPTADFSDFDAMAVW